MITLSSFFLLQYFFTIVIAILEVQYDLLFVFHDAGESLGLQPVVDNFIKDYEDTHVAILCLGEPSTTTYADYPQSTTLESLGIEIDSTQDRDELLTEDDLMRIVSHFPATTVVCGMAYAMQAQICSNILTSNGDHAYNIAFYDSFALWSSNSTAAVYFTNPTPEAVQTVMVSASDQLISLTSPPDAVSPACSIALTGNPTLESWEAEDSNELKKHVTRNMLYGSDNHHIVGIVFAGGYGGEEYDDSLNIFCSTTKKICQESNTCSIYNPVIGSEGAASVNSTFSVLHAATDVTYAFIFAPHPGHTAVYEAGLFHDAGCFEYIRILPEEFSISTAEVIVSSNVSVSQCSTVGGQSLSTGVAHAYLTTPHGCEDVFTYNKLIPIASSAAELSYLLLESDDFRGTNNDYYVDPAAMVVAGVPVNGTANIMQEITMHV